MVPELPSAAPVSPPASAGDEQLTGEELLRWRRQQLALGGSAADFDWLLDLGGGIPWPRLQACWLHPESSLSLARGREALASLWRRHLEGDVPLQYLIGHCPWRDLDLLVAPGVLIPRQETELLVDLALAGLPPAARRSAPLLWADLGTGSGCLAVALARALPAGRGFAVEISPEALRLADLNLRRADVSGRVTLLRGSWWEPLRPWWGRLDLVVANPPYIPAPLLRQLEPVVRDHEPQRALDGGIDGLDSIRAVVAGASRGLAPGGRLLLEHHHDQSEAVLGLLRAAGLIEVHHHPDIEGVRRFASARRARSGEASRPISP
jgi:release factor glutamine methyltransferase